MKVPFLGRNYNHSTRNRILWYLLEGENSCFVTKIVQSLPMFVYLFFPKAAQMVLEKRP